MSVSFVFGILGIVSTVIVLCNPGPLGEIKTLRWAVWVLFWIGVIIVLESPELYVPIKFVLQQFGGQ